MNIPHLLLPPQEYLNLFEEMMSYFGLKRIKNDGIWGLSGFLDPPPPKLKRIEYVRLGSVSPPYGQTCPRSFSKEFTMGGADLTCPHDP